jgi:alpha-L-fucosidase
MANYEYVKGPFEPTFQSLYGFECPEWFRDAKFGIWSHWGAQSVPMYGDWYARNMYIQGHPQNLYHIRRYGHPSEFGYKDLVKLWRAESFDPDGLMDLYVKAGAKYFFAQTTHHDNFFNYGSKVQPFNSVNYGPGKDIVSMWQAAARKRGLKFGISEHLGASFEWLNTNKGHDETGPYAGVPYDGCDKRFEQLYLDNAEYLDLTKPRMHYTLDRRWPPVWYRAVKEMLDTFRPDMLYSDGAVPFYREGATTEDPTYEPGLKMVAHLYNSSAAANGSNQAVYMQKDSRKAFYDIGILDIERSLAGGIKDKPWQTDTCLGNWFYNVRTEYKTFPQVVSLLVDIVAKNGNLLLNVPQKPDGTIDYECRYVLDKLAEWFAVCGEGIYGTRPWELYGEGPSQVPTENRAEGQGMAWTPYDYRFTARGNTVYAFVMGRPATAVLHSLGSLGAVRSVRLLGAGSVPFRQELGVLTVQLPERLPLDTVNCLAVER